MRPLGAITRKWETTDDEGTWRHRERVGAIAECPKCGEDVELVQETEEWQETREGSRVYRHAGYGPSMGECCDLLFADWWDGCFTFEAPKAGAA